MNTAQRAIGCVATVVALVAAVPADVSAKCGLTPTVPEVALIIDGSWVLEVNPYADLFNPTNVMDREVLDRAGVDLIAEEILMINHGCHTVRDETTGAVKIQSAVIVTTMKALEDALSHLSDLQEDYRETSGRYATAFSELPGFATLYGVSLTMDVQENGWTGTARYGNSAVTCHLAVGNQDFRLPGQTLGEVACNQPQAQRN